MTWFADLSPYQYAGYSHEKSLFRGAVPNRTPLLNIGWLEAGQPFPKGALPTAFERRLAELVKHAPTRRMRGLHWCDLCPSSSSGEWSDWEKHPNSSSEIRALGGDGTRYAAPSLVHHYITAHGYLPPPSFVDAVLRLPDISPEEAWKRDLCVVCASSLRRWDSFDCVLGSTRKPVLSVWFWCDACGTEYQRTFPR